MQWVLLMKTYLKFTDVLSVSYKLGVFLSSPESSVALSGYLNALCVTFKKKKFNKKESAKNIFFFLCISGQLGVIEKLCWRDDVLDDSGTIAEK